MLCDHSSRQSFLCMQFFGQQSLDGVRHLIEEGTCNFTPQRGTALIQSTKQACSLSSRQHGTSSGSPQSMENEVIAWQHSSLGFMLKVLTAKKVLNAWHNRLPCPAAFWPVIYQLMPVPVVYSDFPNLKHFSKHQQHPPCHLLPSH